jgi:flagellar biosynthesis/type III secretory pathway chaperone
MPETFIDIMLQSLKKKERVLDEIIRLNDLQKECLSNLEKTVDEFDKTVEGKSACIKQLEQLDSGFEKLYAQVSDELAQNREAHTEQIRQLQGRIRSVTEKSVKIQAQEARNKDMMREKFHRVKEQTVSVRANSRAIQGYYNSMRQW